MQFKDMMRHIESGETFSVKFVSCDRTRRKGGALKFLENLQLLVQEDSNAQGTGNRQAKGRPGYRYEHSRQWLNLWHATTGRYIRLYKRLIVEFNGKTVEY